MYHERDRQNILDRLDNFLGRAVPIEDIDRAAEVRARSIQRGSSLGRVAVEQCSPCLDDVVRLEHSRQNDDPEEERQ